jgi:predicted secreted protein
MAFRSRDFLLKAYISGQYVTVAAVRSKSFSIGGDTVDITNSESGDWRQLKQGGYGLRSCSISGSGAYKTGVTTQHMEDLAWGLRSGVFRILFGNGDTIDGSFRVTSMSNTGGVGDTQNFDFAMSSTGPVTLTRYSNWLLIGYAGEVDWTAYFDGWSAFYQLTTAAWVLMSSGVTQADEYNGAYGFDPTTFYHSGAAETDANAIWTGNNWVVVDIFRGVIKTSDKAGADFWGWNGQTLGSAGYSFGALGYDPVNGRIVAGNYYSGGETAKAIYYSDDEGESWLASSVSLNHTGIFGFARGASYWVAACKGRVIRSVAGATWTVVTPSLWGTVSRGGVAVDPITGTFLACNSVSVFRSTDSGATWAIVLSPTQSPIKVAFKPGSRAVVVGVDSGTNLRTWVSDDNGLTWTDLGASVALGNVQTLVYGDGYFAFTDDNYNTVTSDDDGGTWTLNAQMGVGNRSSLTYSPDSPVTILLDPYWTGTRWLVVWEQRIVYSTTHRKGETGWSIISKGGNLPNGTFHIAGHRGTDIVIVGYGGVAAVVSVDEGFTWTPCLGPTISSEDIVGVVAGQAGNYVSLGNTAYLNKSTNGGFNWVNVTPVGWANSGGGTLIHNIATGIIICVSGTTGSDVWRSVDQGSTWTLIGTVNTGTTVSGISNDAGVMMIVGNHAEAGGELFILKSTDDGLTWFEITPGVSIDHAYTMKFGNGRWAIGFDLYVMDSLDNGSTWSTLLNPPLVSGIGGLGFVDAMA